MERRDHTIKVVDRFIDASKKQHISIMAGDSTKANIQAKRIYKAFLEIREIGNEAREALLEQVDNTDDGVASLAATFSLKYNTEKSLNALKRISEQNTGIIGFEAQQAILRWKEGSWQLE